jgi:hypothetical protein
MVKQRTVNASDAGSNPARRAIFMKKSQQLGMNSGTAAHRLRARIMFSLAVAAGHKCYRCGGELTPETFSIDHKVAWLDSADPVALFFDIDNIAFSHMSCNYGAKRQVNKIYHTPESRREADLELNRNSKRRNYTKERRQQKWREKGY